MPIIPLLLITALLCSCSYKPIRSYDPFAQELVVDDKLILSTERADYLAYRYYHDMLEPTYLNYLQGVQESYRFTFTGDYEPELVVRINNWGWNDSYSISVKKRSTNDFHAESCIRDPKVENIYRCPSTNYSEISNYKISRTQWVNFKLLINASEFWESDTKLHPKKKYTILHGTHWSVEAYRDIDDGETTKQYSVNTPNYGTNIYNIGAYILELADEKAWLDRTKAVN